MDFVDRLGEMRNAFVHDIRNIDMGINGLLTNLNANNKEKYNEWLKDLVQDEYPEDFTLKDIGKILREDFVIRMAKYIVSDKAISVLSAIYFKELGIKFRTRKNLYFDGTGRKTNKNRKRHIVDNRIAGRVRGESGE